MLPTVTLAKNILGAVTLMFGDTPHHLVVSGLKSNDAKEDFKAALLGLMANEDYEDFEDLDADVFIYDTLSVGGLKYRYVDQAAAEKILQVVEEHPETVISLNVHPSRAAYANTILRALVDPVKLKSTHPTDLTNELIQLNII